MDGTTETWVKELGARLWFLPDVERTARAVLEGDLPASAAAVRWKEDLPRAFAEDLVSEELVALALAELIQPVLADLPAVFDRGQAREAFDRLLDATVQDLADRFCDVNADAVGRVASGLARLARGDTAGEGELAEALGAVLSDPRRLVAALDATPELDEMVDCLREAATAVRATRQGPRGEA